MFHGNRFKGAAKGKRGVTAWVEREGDIYLGDTLTLHGQCHGDGYTIGFGDCIGTVLPALKDPFAR